MSPIAILIVLGFILIGVRMAAFPALTAPLHCFHMRQAEAITASGDDIATYKVPFPCRIVRIKAGVEEIDDATDVDIDVEAAAVDLCDPLAVADSSAIVAGGVEDDPDDGVEELAAGVVLHMDVDITGGSTPTVEGCWAEVWVIRTS